MLSDTRSFNDHISALVVDAQLILCGMYMELSRSYNYFILALLSRILL